MPYPENSIVDINLSDLKSSIDIDYDSKIDNNDSSEVTYPTLSNDHSHLINDTQVDSLLLNESNPFTSSNLFDSTILLDEQLTFYDTNALFPELNELLSDTSTVDYLSSYLSRDENSYDGHNLIDDSTEMQIKSNDLNLEHDHQHAPHQSTEVDTMLSSSDTKSEYKLAQRRENNRLAAQKSREKKKTLLETLEQTIVNLTDTLNKIRKNRPQLGSYHNEIINSIKLLNDKIILLEKDYNNNVDTLSQQRQNVLQEVRRQASLKEIDSNKYRKEKSRIYAKLYRDKNKAYIEYLEGKVELMKCIVNLESELTALIPTNILLTNSHKKVSNKANNVDKSKNELMSVETKENIDTNVKKRSFIDTQTTSSNKSQITPPQPSKKKFKSNTPTQQSVINSHASFFPNKNSSLILPNKPFVSNTDQNKSMKSFTLK